MNYYKLLYTKHLRIITASLLLLTFSRCSKVLDDVTNLSNYPPDKVWNDEALTNAYLVDIYGNTLPAWPIDQGAITDECGSNIVAADFVTSQTTNFKPWHYITIRRINIMLDELSKSSLSENFKNKIIGQGHFMRAWLYYDMVTNFGGVPIITKVQNLNEDLLVKRNTSAECFEFILSDLEKAAANLPNKSVAADFGRIDKSIVAAFKGRVMLRKASPQFNPSNPYGNGYWQDAYNANTEALTFLTANGFALVDEYDDIFKKEGNKEVIMITQYVKPAKTNTKDQCARPLSESKDCTGSDQPVWSLVEAYPMADGAKVSTSIRYAYDTQTYWKNRDPRFYKTIVYNGALFELGGKSGRYQYTSYDLVPFLLASLDDIFGNKQSFSRTGFYSRKGLETNLSQAEVRTNSTDWVEIRFAEIMFNVAEAANETGRMQEAIDILIQIRKRAGIEAGIDSRYGIPLIISKEDLRNLIIEDKRIEFAFEGKRLDDLRRTRRWHLLNGTKKYGAEAFLKREFIDNSGKLTKPKPESQDFTYTVRELIINNAIKTMIIPEKYYFFPLRKTDLESNPNLLQNSGWDGGTFDPTLR